MTRLGADLSPVSRPVVGIAMCITPMGFLYAWALRLVQREMKARRLGSGRGDDATGDTVAGVAGGVGLHVVGLLVDDDGGASVGDDAVRRGGVKREVVDVEGGLAEMAFAYCHVLREVARVMAHGVFEAVLLIVGI